jgi:hypothetical protein
MPGIRTECFHRSPRILGKSIDLRVDGRRDSPLEGSGRGGTWAIFGGLTAPVITYFTINWHSGFVIPMLVGTVFGCISVAAAVLLGPETRGKVLSAELTVA